MNEREESFSLKGSVAGYNKNHETRQKDDYYAIPYLEVYNVLNQLNIDFNGATVLDTCVGQGHLLKGVVKYLKEKNQKAKLYGTDLVYRHILPELEKENAAFSFGQQFDFLKSDYNSYVEKADYIIINPPFKYLEEFFLKSYEMSKKGLLMFCRINYLEGISRYTNIHSKIKPTKIFGYVDRVACDKNGIEKSSGGVQFHSWVYYDKADLSDTCEYVFLRKYNKGSGIEK